MPKIAGVILAGGKSSRMGCDKSQLEYKGMTLKEHCRNLFHQVDIEDVFISGKDGIKDIYHDKGPISGIYSCLESLSDFNRVLFIPVDMPLLNKDIVFELINSRITDFSCFENYNLPIIFNNSITVRRAVHDQIKTNTLAIHKLMVKLKGNFLVTNHNKEYFINTNTPQQWQNI